MSPAGVRNTLALALCCQLLACAGGSPKPAAVSYFGELDLVLEPNSVNDFCSVTVGLRNVSGVRQDEAYLELDFFNGNDDLLQSERIRMDPLRVGRYDAGNASVAARCESIDRAVIRSAEWTIYNADRDAPRQVVSMSGVTGTLWQFGWSEENQLFIGTKVAE